MFNKERLDPIYDDPHSFKSRMFLHYADLSGASALARLIGKMQARDAFGAGVSRGGLWLRRVGLESAWGD